MAKDDYCVYCLLEVARNMVSADSYRDRRTSMKELAEAALAGKCLDGPLYCVSRTWYVNVLLFHLLSEIQCLVFAASLLVRIFYLVMSRLIQGQIFPK